MGVYLNSLPVVLLTDQLVHVGEVGPSQPLTAHSALKQQKMSSTFQAKGSIQTRKISKPLQTMTFM